MNVLVDTSVWSHAFREHPGAAALDVLRKNIELGRVVLLGMIVQEVLQGFRRERDVALVAKNLDAFPVLQLSRADHVAAAELHRACRRRGIAATTIDCHIASAAKRHRCALLTVDKDFTHIAKVNGVKLLA